MNQEFINLIRQKCMGNDSINKSTLLVISNIVGENIEVTDENSLLYKLQASVTDICNFIANCMDINGMSDDMVPTITYSLKGYKVTASKGVNIVRDKDGKTKKTINK